MPRIKQLSPLLFLLLGGCVPYANDYAPTRERQVSYNGSPRQLPSRFAMNDARAQQHFVYGIDAASFDGEFRKVGPRAAFRLGVAGGKRLVMVYRSMVPQTVRVKANGVVVGEFNAGERGQWSAALPATVAIEGMPTLLELGSETGLAIASVALEN